MSLLLSKVGPTYMSHFLLMRSKNVRILLGKDKIQRNLRQNGERTALDLVSSNL
jgi:hypothetical protein